MTAIRIEGLTRRYGPRRGVDGIDLNVGEGSLFGFLGPNGAGKTTTIRVLMGLLRPTSGRAAMLGLDCWSEGARARAEVGYLPGDLRLYSWMRGVDALRIFGAARGRDVMGAGRELAGRFGLDLKVKVRAMSRGTRQKLGLVLAMAHRPRLLILDEPTSGLDPLVQASLREELRGMAAAGHTVFFSSHTLAEVEELCDRIAIVKDGRIVEDASLAQLRARAGHEVTIKWRSEEDAGAEAPEFLRVARKGRVWTGMLDGEVSRLVEFLSGRGVEDLTIGRPDLETLFQRFYAPGDA